MPYRGELKGIEERTARKQKKYHVATIGNDEVSIWDGDVLQALQAVPERTEIEYEFRKSGNFKNLTSWNPLQRDRPREARSLAGSAYIRRMAALKNATRTLDADGFINVTDFTQFASYYGVPCPWHTIDVTHA